MIYAVLSQDDAVIGAEEGSEPPISAVEIDADLAIALSAHPYGLGVWDRCLCGGFVINAERLAANVEAHLSRALAARRYDEEVAGVTWRGLSIATDRASQSKLHVAYTMARDGVRVDGSTWKCADGVARPMSNADMIDLALRVGAYVQACFDVEATKAEELRTSGAVDIDAGWPSRDITG